MAAVAVDPNRHPDVAERTRRVAVGQPVRTGDRHRQWNMVADRAGGHHRAADHRVRRGEFHMVRRRAAVAARCGRAPVFTARSPRPPVARGCRALAAGKRFGVDAVRAADLARGAVCLNVRVRDPARLGGLDGGRGMVFSDARSAPSAAHDVTHRQWRGADLLPHRQLAATDRVMQTSQRGYCCGPAHRPCATIHSTHANESPDTTISVDQQSRGTARVDPNQ